MDDKLTEKIITEFKEYILEKAEEFYLKINEILENQNLLMCNSCKQNNECDIQIHHVIKNGCRLYIPNI